MSAAEQRTVTTEVLRLPDRETDAQLVLAAQDGDSGASAQLFRRHVRAAYGTAYRLMGRDQDLEDIVQESFTKALSTIDQLRDPQAFRPWLMRIVVGVAVANLRRRRLLARLGMLRTRAIAPDELISPKAPPDVVVELRAIYGLLDQLRTEERVVLVLRRVEEMTLPEIAACTGKSLATVKRHLARAETRLAAALEDPR